MTSQGLLSLLFIIGLLAACSNPSSSASPLDTSSKTGNDLISEQDMQEIATGVYVEPTMQPAMRQKLLRDLGRAKNQVASFFGGSLQSAPQIYACATDACMDGFGGAGIEAKSLGRSKIILSRRGSNRTIMAHELVHIELHHRLGENVNLHRIPMWFDEGLAVLACDDPRFRSSFAERPSLKGRNEAELGQLHTEEQWLSSVYSGGNPYQVSRDAVARWYSREGTVGLLQLIEGMRETGNFPHEAVNGVDRMNASFAK